MRAGPRVPVLAAAAGACVLAPALMAAEVDSLLRVAAVLALFAIAPGAALVGLLAPRPIPAELALVVGVSLGVSTLAAQLMLALDLWSPQAATFVLALLCLPPIALQLLRLRGARGRLGS